MELWTMTVPTTAGVEERVARLEEQGWDGVTMTDSQNLCPDPFVVLGLAARASERLGLATGVTNVHTRHPAALATAAATVQELSDGRFVLGTGRGDTALFHLGLPPMPLGPFFERTDQLQAYLRGDDVDQGGRPSRLRWLGRAAGADRRQTRKVPLDLAVSGPKMISYAARTAERITFALGADPDRLAWAVDLARSAAAEAGRQPDRLDLGAYLTIGCHPDRDAARAMVRGSVAAFAHFSAMPGSTGAGLAPDDQAVVSEVGRRYDSNRHLRNDADHTGALDDAFTDRFAIIGSPEEVIERLTALHQLGISRAVITGPGFGADPEHAATTRQLMVTEVLPAAHQLPSERAPLHA